MADLFRRFEDRVGAGGIKCYCCNWTKDNSKNRKRTRKNKQLLKGKARTFLKKDLLNELENIF